MIRSPIGNGTDKGFANPVELAGHRSIGAEILRPHRTKVGKWTPFRRGGTCGDRENWAESFDAFADTANPERGVNEVQVSVQSFDYPLGRVFDGLILQ